MPIKAKNKRKPSVAEIDVAYMHKRQLIRFMRLLRLTNKAPTLDEIFESALRRPRIKILEQLICTDQRFFGR